MSAGFDVLIVGSGPAGVSAAFPLLDAGLQVLMVDGGTPAVVPPPTGQLLQLRERDPQQWRWMVGSNYHALRQIDALSPKLRVPTHADVFAGFAAANRIDTQDFIAVGSLAPGGLSKAWGCGVATLSADELAPFPFPSADLRPSYEAVTRRIGVSGAASDDLADYFGLDDWAQPPVALDALQAGLLQRYTARPAARARAGFRLGRSRVAALTEAMPGREACDLSGTCLWGCARRALYSATDDLRLLRERANFHYRPGFVVDRVIRSGSRVGVQAGNGGGEALHARRLVLAAGTLASTRLALQVLAHRDAVPLQSCPSAAFLLCVPRQLGRRRVPAFGLGQLSFALALAGQDGSPVTGFGSLFDTGGIPVAEFARFLPMARRHGVDVLASLLPACVVGNLFLPGHLLDARLSLGADDALQVRGRYAEPVPALMAQAQAQLRAHFRRLGAIMLPFSFALGKPGGDLHYAGSLPMRAQPARGQTDRWGELAGYDGVHVVDGASLSALTEKSHTLTLMANADRIGRRLGQVLGGQAQ
ncbi:MAG: FAD-dependent monooxygenase [Burkholderiaceae bacterium]